MLNKTVKRLREYLHLFRMRLGVYTSIIPVTGALSMGVIQWERLALFYLMGWLFHICGHVANDFFDREHDKKSWRLPIRPLASGSISPKVGLRVTISTALLFWILIIIFFPRWDVIIAALVLTASGFAYDILGKKILVSDLFLSVSIFCLCLMSALASGKPLTLGAFLICVIWGLEWLYFNIFASLSDVGADSKGGAKTITLASRVKWTGYRFRFPPSFIFIVSGIRILEILCVLSFFVAPSLKTGYTQSPVLLLLILLCVTSMMILHLRLILPKQIDIRSFPIIAVLNVILGCLLVFLLLLPLSGIWLPLFFLGLSILVAMLLSWMIHGRLFYYYFKIKTE